MPPLRAEGTPAGQPPPADPRLRAMPQAPEKVEDPGPGADLVFPRGSAPMKRGENKVPVNVGLCLSIVDVSEGTLWKPWLPQGLPLCWEWNSTRAFDCGQIGLHSHRLSCQRPGLRVGGFDRGGKASLCPCPPPRQCMLPEDQHGTPCLGPSVPHSPPRPLRPGDPQPPLSPHTDARQLQQTAHVLCGRAVVRFCFLLFRL